MDASGSCAVEVQPAATHGTQGENTVGIGELAARTGLPVKTIRYYSDIGLRPESGRSRGGHRRYAADALPRLRLIQRLRALDTPIDSIATVMTGQHSLADLVTRELDTVQAHMRELTWRQGILWTLDDCPELERLRRLALLAEVGKLDEAHDRLVRYWHWALPTSLPHRLPRAVIEGAVPVPPATPTGTTVLAYAELHALTSGDDRRRHPQSHQVGDVATPRRSVHTSAPGYATQRTTARSRCATGGSPSLSPAKPRLNPPPPARDTSPLPWPPCMSKSPASRWPRSTGPTAPTPQSASPKRPEEPGAITPPLTTQSDHAPSAAGEYATPDYARLPVRSPDNELGVRLVLINEGGPRVGCPGFGVMVFWTAFLPPHHHAGRPKTQTMITSVPAFASMAMLINMAPGPDTLLVVRTSMTQGRQGGLAAALGILTGCAGWGIATAAGLTAVLTASPPAYDMLRICGAAYLAYLGATALWHSRRPAGPEPAGQTTTPAGRSSAFRAGMGTNLLNPKAGVFYMSLIPQFVPPGAPMFSTTLLFTAIDVIELAAWYWLLSHAASALGTRIQRPVFRRRLEQLTGVVFLGFAAALLTYRP